MVGSLPEGVIKRWITKKAYMSSFRVMARCLSAVIRIHNKEYRPRTGGVCVANHTSPVDVLVLSTDNSYSLVSYYSTKDLMSRLWLEWNGFVPNIMFFLLWVFVNVLLLMLGFLAGDVVDFVYCTGGLYTRWGV